MKISYLACALVLVGCEPQLVGELVARPVVRGENSVGWQRVELDGVAHRERDSLWLGDGQGRSVPFLFETGEVWRPKQLEVVDPLAGKNESNQPTFEFGVGVPQGWQVGEREQLRVDFELGYVGTFVADVVVERKRDDGQWLTSDASFHLYDLAGSGARKSISIPWDAQRYRVRLIVTQGSVESIDSIAVTAQTVPESVAPLRVAPSKLERQGKSSGSWSVELAQAERVVGFEVELAPPVAPVSLTVNTIETAAPGKKIRSSFVGSSLVWNLPAVHSKAKHIDVDAVVGDHFEVELPPQVDLTSLTALVVREKIIFPAEANQEYFVHLGGVRQDAPGNLGRLPTSSRSVYQQPTLTLGPAQEDPHGVAREVSASERTRPWLVWVVGAIVAGLGLVAVRLLRGSSGENSNKPESGA